MVMDLGDFLLVAATAFIGAGLVTAVLQRLDRRKRPRRALAMVTDAGPIFLFQGHVLLDATPDALAIIQPHLSYMSEHAAVIFALDPLFPGLKAALEDGNAGAAEVSGQGSGRLWIEINRIKGRTRLSVKGKLLPRENEMHASIARDMQVAELATLRDLTRHTPQLIWQEDLSGKLLWANQAYLALWDRVRSPDKTKPGMWPNDPLLPDLSVGHIGTQATLRRVSVKLPKTSTDKSAVEQWFDVTSIRRDAHVIHFANDANAIVRADKDRRNFVQTLTKTFAQLSIGLAIFDKHRRLAMFNPALLEMTDLPIDFLSARPSVDAVLDLLRESRMLPEPKDYSSWREQFTALEQAAKAGSYSENWTLPDGQTYRVTGRPHPDGAIAFLFEDITAEVSLTRSFRSDIQTSQAVLDTLSDAIAVFSATGTLVMSNRAYTELWGDMSDKRIAQHQVQQAIKLWQAQCVPSKIWAELQQFIQMMGHRKPWSDYAVLDDGRNLSCQAVPLAGSMTMVKFSIVETANPLMHNLTRHNPALMIAKR